MAILTSLTRLMELYTRNLDRADERLAEAAKAVAIEQEQIAEERSFLAMVASTYVEFSQVIGAEALAMSGETWPRERKRNGKTGTKKVKTPHRSDIKSG